MDAIIEADLEAGYRLVQRASSSYAYGDRTMAETAHVAAELQYTRAVMHLGESVKQDSLARAAAKKVAQFWEALQALPRNSRS